MNELTKLDRRRINDVVRTFCYLCAKPRQSYDHQWPFILSPWQVHLGDIETSHYGSRSRELFRYFFQYANSVYSGKYGYFLSLLRSLELYTAQWSWEHFHYADQLLVKYYFKETSDGRLEPVVR